MEEQINQVLESFSTLNKWRNNFDSEEWKAANDLHRKMFGQSLTQSKNCGCLDDFQRALQSKHKKHNTMSDSNALFVLKEDKLIQSHAGLISKNSSEEDLKRLLRYDKRHIASFEKYPDNWEEVIYATEEAKIEPMGVATKEAPIAPLNNEPTSNGNSRFSELSEMKNSELKAIISLMKLELPEDTRKPSLVQFIIDNE